MLCPNCGYDNSRTNRFCVRCGVDLAGAPQPAGAGTAPPPPPNPWGTPPGEWAAPGAAPPPPPPGPPPPGPGPYGQYPPPYGPPGYQPPAINGLAIASFVLGLVGWVPCGIGSVAAIVLGFVARTQIRESHGRQGGDGLAMAGIILGFLAIAFLVAIIVIGTVSRSTTGQS